MMSSNDPDIPKKDRITMRQRRGGGEKKRPSPSVAAESSEQAPVALHDPPPRQPQQSPPPQPPQPFKMGTAALAVMIFYSVSGGPFGVEPTVRAAGNFYALLGFAIAPLVWSVPEALVTAELSSAYPDASGGVAWVEEAFGSGAGFAIGFFHWVGGATDNALYPVLFYEYLRQHLDLSGGGGGADDDDGGGGFGGLTRFLILSSMTIALVHVNLSGLDVVSNVSMLICFLSMSPFVVMIILGLPKVDPSRWLQTPDASIIIDVVDDGGSLDQSGGWLPSLNLGGILWPAFLNNLFWNLSAFDYAGTFVEDVKDPATTLPRAMFLSIFLVVAAYFVPLLFAIGAVGGNQQDWVDGYFATVCAEVGGPWLGGWTVFAAGISNIALFLSDMSSNAFRLMGMAERGLLPKIFAVKNRHGSPTYGVLLGTVVILVMFAMTDFESLVELLNFNYMVALLMEYSAFVKLRISQPDVHRPYKIPLSTAGCMIALLPTFGFSLLVMALGSYLTYMGFCVVGIVGFVLWRLQSGEWAAKNVSTTRKER